MQKTKGVGLQMLKNGIGDVNDNKTRAYVGKLCAVIGIICNILLALGKIVAGVMASSMSIVADGMNNLSDVASSAVTLIGFKLAEKPADGGHPFGHARFEYLSGLCVAALIFTIGIELLKTSVKKIITPQSVEFTYISVVILVISIFVKLWLSLFNKKMGEKINSATLKATAMDSRNDVITTTAVLTAVIIQRFTGLNIDGYMGLLVAVFILAGAVSLAKETISTLLGEAANPKLQKEIKDFIMECPKVIDCHDLMVHDYGPGQRFATIHVEMDKNEDPLESHRYLDEMERECLKKYGVHLVIHYDPVITDNPEIKRMKNIVTAILKVKDSRITIHDFRIIEEENNTRLTFDVELPEELMRSQNGIKHALEQALNDMGEKNYITDITFDPVVFVDKD